MTVEDSTDVSTEIMTYLDKPYHFELVHDRDDDDYEGWVVEVEELPGCISQGTTPDEAIERAHDAMKDWIAVAIEDGRDIPEPRAEPVFSGKFVVRIPRGLHAEIHRRAEAEGVSLNQFVMAVLAGAVGWHNQESARA